MNVPADIRDQYRIIASGAGWIDRSRRGRIRFEGRDAAAFLHALVSNDVASLGAGGGTYATYLTPQGRMVADLHVYNRGDHLIASVPPDAGAALASRFDQVIFSEDVRVSDVTGEIAQVEVLGGAAAATAARACGLDVSRLESLGMHAHTGEGDTFIARTDAAALPGFDVFVPAARRAELIAALQQAGAVPIGDGLRESLRIEAARPEFGVDMTSDTIPLEAGLLERGISTSKGCYVGQEVIIRVLHRGGGRIAKRLVALALDPGVDELPAPGTALHAAGRETGRITSAAWSPHEPRVIALGYVHRDHSEIGQLVKLHAAGRDWEAEITRVAH
jgi:folate-binding protein YgfZ